MNHTQIQSINIALTTEVHAQAQQFAARQNTTKKGKKVYLNALAVYAVWEYFRWLEIDSELQNSDSWQLGIQSISNTADLLIPNIGRLECCPVLPQENHLTISPQASEARIGYVAVQFSDRLDRVQIIGFLPPVAPSRESLQIPLRELQSLELLLTRISQSIAVEVTEAEPKIAVNLSRWWSEVLEPGWLSLETLFGENFVGTNLALRNSIDQQKDQSNNPNLPIQVRKGKLIDLGIKLGNDAVALVISCTLPAAEAIDILLQVYPSGKQIYLPANLELKVSDETKNVIPELLVKARNLDNCIQLSFTGDPGEKFSVTLTLGGISFTENFQI